MKKIIFRAPVQTASGYGVYSRSILSALDKTGKYDITVMSVPWGATPLIYEKTPEMKRIDELARKFDPQKMGPDSFDASVQVTIPNEFMKLAPKNICITAGIEVDRVAPVWLQKTNEIADALFVPSMHAAQAFTMPKYQAQNGSELKLEKPLFISPDWIDTSLFNPAKLESQDPRFQFPGKFNFLAMGLGLDRAEGHDRKNFHQLIRWFCEQFKGNPDVGLVLKLSMVNNSPIDFRNVAGRIAQIKANSGCGQFPRIHLIHGRLSDGELAALFKSDSIHAFLTLTHGEGYGLPIIEAAACGLPVVATDWSGHLDFLTKNGKKLFIPVNYELADVSKESVWKDVYEEGTKWAWPVETDAKMKMAKIVLSYDTPKSWATELAEHIVSEYGFKAEDDFIKTFDKLLEGEQVKPSTVEAPRAPASFLESVEQLKSKFKADGKKTLLFTMPMSAGDVYLSTGTVSSLRKKFPDHKIFFATSPQFFSILSNNSDIDEVVEIENWMSNIHVCGLIFDEIFTPNLDIQLITSNWIRGGHGRKLAEEIAHRCDTFFDKPKITAIQPEKFTELPEKYIAFHPGAGKSKWSARNFKKWNEVLSKIDRTIKIVQVGMPDEPLVDGVDIDFRGKHTGYNQFAWLIKNSVGVIGIDSFSAHLAAGFNKPLVSIYGNTFSTKTGPTRNVGENAFISLIDSPDRMGCKIACYKDACFVNAENPCINNISVDTIVKEVNEMIELYK